MTNAEAATYAQGALGSPDLYKVCATCRCLWKAHDIPTACTVCSGQSFFTDEATVIDAARRVLAALAAGAQLAMPKHLETMEDARMNAGHKILARPQDFAVCECCNGIVTKATFVCPACLGYAINHCAELVRASVLKNLTGKPSTVLPEDLR